ncbi:cell division protein ZapA [Novosphingobium sp. ERN07]|uniref:cell division protein ZapA n=1 Tax=Novosphingobium sp. ERN07 TaxID=2726187 RepID=UPI0014576487|nr:cell division protein ZapA [Novosphingobium sp. ERN07]NLR70051.1 cell division protein ZapA [Novosphingobium sp. ERN07]
MSNLTLTIGGRPFAVSCADGEEAHIEMLGRMVDDRARRIGLGQGEPRMLLFSALMLADELHEAHRNAPIEPVAEVAKAASDEADSAEQILVGRINLLAERLEKLAATLEQGPVSA